MIRWVAGLARRAGGAILLLLMLLCGAEVALRLADLRASGRNSSSHSSSPRESLTVPSWTTHQELRPSAVIQIPGANSSEAHRLRINSFGVRGLEPDIPKPRDLYRILCLGDERLLAAELADEEQLCVPLQRRLQPETKLRVEVWNAGVPGACPLTQFLMLTHRLAALQPDLVLSFVHVDDLAEDQTYRRFTRMDRQGQPLGCRHPTLGRARQSSAITAWRQEFRLVDGALDWAGAAWKERTSLDAAIEAGTIRDNISRLQQDSTIVDRTLQPLASLSSWCRNSYVSHAVILVSDPEPGQGPESPFPRAVQDFSRRQELPLIHLVATADSAVAAKGLSWPPQDHRDFAEEIARRVLSEIDGPWSSPYFKSEQQAVTPVSHRHEPPPRRMIKRAAPKPGNFH